MKLFYVTREESERGDQAPGENYGLIKSKIEKMSPKSTAFESWGRMGVDERDSSVRCYPFPEGPFVDLDIYSDLSGEVRFSGHAETPIYMAADRDVSDLQKALARHCRDPEDNVQFTFGDQQEYVAYNKELLTEDYWDDWNKPEAGVNTEALKVYIGIHQEICKVVSALTPKNATILEIFSGDGTLAENLKREFEKNGKQIASYTMIERNRNLVDRAKQTFSTEENVQIIQAAAEDSQAYKDVERGSIDCIIGSGALASQVVERGEAMLILENLYPLLRPGGHIVLSSYTHSILKKEDFKKLGYKVFNTYHPGLKRAFYIVQKPGVTVGTPGDQREYAHIENLHFIENYYDAFPLERIENATRSIKPLSKEK